MIATGDAGKPSAPACRSRRLRRIGRAVLLAASVAAAGTGALTFVINPILHRFTGEFEDFNAYYDASRFVRAGASPYTDFNAGATNMTMSGFIYPPVVAWGFQPIGALPKDAGARLWLWIGLVSTIAAILVIALTVLPARWPRVQIGVLVSFVYAPATYNLWHGQMTPLVLLMLAIAMWAYVNDREVLCGVILACAASVKVAPVVLAILLLRRRWWRGLAAMGAVGSGLAGLGVLAAGWDATHRYVTNVLPALGRQNGWFTNEGWNGAVNRAAGHAVTTLEPTSLPIAAITLVLVLGSVGIAAMVVRPGRRSRAERGAEYGVATAAMMLAEATAWYPHQTYMLPALAAAAALIMERDGSSQRWLMAGLASALVTIVIIGPLIIGRFPGPELIAAYRRPGGYALIQLWSLPTAGAVMLLATLARAARPQPPAPAGQAERR